MAERRVLGTVAEKSQIARLAEFFQQAEREFLAVIADRFVLRIEFRARQDLIEISLAERLPIDRAVLKPAQQLLARPEICHPHQRCGKLSGFFDAEWGLGGRQPNAEKTESTGFESVSKRV
ncbi:MAG: hypothetical protein ACI8UO_006642, partial [Verrucomicrobiales bacterium]